MGEQEFLRVESGDGIASVTLVRPPLNVLHTPMLDELNGVLDPLVADTGLAAIVLRAEGKAFCAGVDVADHTPELVGEMIRRFHAIFRSLARTDAVTIAAVQGSALGGGCELACFCDIVLASDRARFAQPEVHVGVFPPVAACALPARVGIARAIELTALGGSVDADEAQRIGLVSHVYPGNEFSRRVEEYMEQIRKLSRPVVRLAKRATSLEARQQILAHLDQAERLYLDDLMQLADAREGVAAFMEKRAPVWAHA